VWVILYLFEHTGGLLGGRFYILGGIPSSSKTALINNVADNICLGNQPVLFFSFDDGREEIRHRTFARFGSHDIETYNIRTLKMKDIEVISNLPALTQIKSCKYVVEQNIPVDNWKYYIDQIIAKTGKSPVILIDYLRKLQANKKTSDERLRVDMLTYKLVEIAKGYNTPVVVISELQRDSYRAGQRLSMASFKGSGSLEYEASWLGILAAVEEKDGEFIIIQ